MSLEDELGLGRLGPDGQVESPIAEADIPDLGPRLTGRLEVDATHMRIHAPSANELSNVVG
jgi:hypothetical protein